jgi:hypothetical protein
MQEYTRNTLPVQAFQIPWNMTITVNGKQISGLAGEWLVIPPAGNDPYFLDDLTFTVQYTTVSTAQ